MATDDQTPPEDLEPGGPAGEREADPAAAGGDEGEGEDEDQQDFASMLEASLEPRSFETGEMVEGVVVAVGSDVAFVDVGGKGEATIDLEELTDADGQLDVRPGDSVKAVVVSTAGGLKLSHKLARGAVSRERLAEAHAAGLPVEGRIERSIKGGYDVRIAGQRAFCPISQVDVGFTEDPSIHEGQVYTFRIMEFGDGGKNLVVSRRALIEEEQREQAGEVRASIVPGADLPGRVASVQPYGAFVDLGGGIQGLLHVSEMGWSRVADPSTVVSPGDEITVRVLRVEQDGRRIALGLKQLQDDPWTGVADTYEPGQVLAGRVTRLAEFGAFVELEPGIEGLAHASTFPPTGRRDGWKDAVAPGAEVAVEVLSVEPGRKRIGVAVVDEGSVRARQAHEEGLDEAAGPAPGSRPAIVPGARLRGKVERHERYGVFVFLAPGKTGLMPLAETGEPRGADMRRALPVGSDVDVMVLEVDPDGRRIRLSRKALDEAAESKTAREYAEREQQDQQSGGFGSLADKLRDAMRRDEG